MGLISTLKQKLLARKFAKNNLNILQNLSFESTQNIIQRLRSEGWELYPDHLDTSNKSSPWQCKLRKGTSILDVTWNADYTASNSHNEGAIIGLERIIVGLGKDYNIPVLKVPELK